MTNHFRRNFSTFFILQDLKQSFPLLISLMNRYELALRKPISNQFHSKKRDLPKWPLYDTFVTVFKEANPENINMIFDELQHISEEAKDDPNAICRHDNCKECFDKHAWSGLLSWSTFIRLNDIDYKGYYQITCQDQCKIEFHPYCWKDKKSQNNLKYEKDFLATPCFTPDCHGLITQIVRFQGKNAKPVVIKSDHQVPIGKSLAKDEKSTVKTSAEESSESLMELIKKHIDQEVEHGRVAYELKNENAKVLAENRSS